MKRLRIALFCLIAVASANLSLRAETEAPVEEKETFGADLSLLVSADLRGETDPCGCKVNPRGGLAKKADILKAMRAEGTPTLFLDGGNSLFSRSVLPERLQDKEKILAGAVAQSHVAMGVGAMGIGPNDFALGAEFLLDLMKQTKLPLVATNLIDGKSGQPILPTSQVIQVGPTRVLALNAIYEGAVVVSEKHPHLKTTDPVQAIGKALKETQPAADLVVLFSSLDEAANRKALEAHPEIRVLISNRAGSGNQGILGGTVTLNLVPKGKFVARLDLDFDQPWEIDGEDPRLETERRLKSIEKTLSTYRNRGDPEEIYEDNPSILEFYRKYALQEKALKKKLEALGPPVATPYRFRQIEVPKDHPDEPVVAAIVEKAKATIKNPPKR